MLPGLLGRVAFGDIRIVCAGLLACSCAASTFRAGFPRRGLALADVRILSAWMRLGSVALLLSRIGGLMRPQQRGKKRQKNVSPHAS